MNVNQANMSPTPGDDDYDSSSSSESTPRNSFTPSPSNGFATYTGPTQATINDYLLPNLGRNSRRFSSTSGNSSSSSSETESEQGAPFLRSSQRRRHRADPNGWSPPRRRRVNERRLWRPLRRCLRQVLRLPFCPTRPLTIVSFYPISSNCIELTLSRFFRSFFSAHLLCFSLYSSCGFSIPIRILCPGAHTALHRPHHFLLHISSHLRRLLFRLPQRNSWSCIRSFRHPISTSCLLLVYLSACFPWIRHSSGEC